MRKLGIVQCLEVPCENRQDEATADVLILFHGFGADAYDLRSLSEVLIPPKPTHWLFPQGVLEVPIGPGWTGRAWWEIDLAALERAAASGQPRDLSETKPEGLEKVRPRVQEMIAKLEVPWNRIILGGFSQGAMLATDLFLRAPEAPKGLLIFSGALLNKTEWKELATKRAGSRFFMSHGNQDMVLAHKGAAQLETLLVQSGLKGSLMTFPGGHEIPMAAIQKANQYLAGL
jgi:phospholipase/carboxylesterase